MTEPGAAPGSGERIGAYEIQGPLGRGGMGEVFLAWDNRLKRRVAIKRIRHDHGLDSVLRQRLLREARAAAGLSHPAVVQVYDLIEDAAGDCIVLEYVEGRTLSVFLAEAGPLEPAAAVRLAREIADGLAAAHAAGIVHRDLKPENVIVTPAGHAKILDFGLAQMRFRAADDAFTTQRGILLGTFHTMSPEQASGDEVDQRSDLFSLGVLLHEMLTGRSPFRGDNPAETLGRVLFAEPPRVDAVRPDVPGRLGELVERLLAKEPGERPESAAEVVRELEAIAALLASAAAPTQVADAADLPTVVDLPRLTASRPIPSSKGADAATGLPIAGHPKNGKRRMIAALLATAILGSVVTLVVQKKWRDQAGTAPLRVLVLQPQMDGRDERLRLAALGVRITSQCTLGALKGVKMIDVATVKLPGKQATPQEMAQDAGAKELLVADLYEVGDRARITLTRQAAKGRVLNKEELTVPINPLSLQQLAKDVETNLTELYGDRHLRGGPLNLEAHTQDCVTILSIWQKLETGTVLPQEDFNRLQKIMAESPNPLDATLLMAEVLFNRFQATHKAVDIDKALSLTEEARSLAPNDSRPLITQFRIEMEEGKSKTATRTLAEIRKLLSPGDPQILELKSNLAERTGRLDAAINDLKLAIRAAPNWQDELHLAGLEARTGHIVDARNHIQQILDNSRDNIFALDNLAEIELLYGDLREAELRYRNLTLRPKPELAHYTNLGIAQILLDHHDEAVQTFQKVLATDPNHVEANVDLAEVEFSSGNTEEGEDHCNKALGEIAKNPAPANRMAQAECLAYLRRGSEAVGIIQAALDDKRDDPNILISAALVHAVVGHRATALAEVKKAIKIGVRTRWFHLPGFDSLKDDPDFQALINKTPEAF